MYIYDLQLRKQSYLCSVNIATLCSVNVVTTIEVHNIDSLFQEDSNNIAVLGQLFSSMINNYIPASLTRFLTYEEKNNKATDDLGSQIHKNVTRVRSKLETKKESKKVQKVRTTS